MCDKPFERDKFELVALSLWKYFEIGAHDAGVDDGVVDHAYDWFSGKLIVKRLSQFGPCGGEIAELGLHFRPGLGFRHSFPQISINQTVLVKAKLVLHLLFHLVKDMAAKQRLQ